MADAGTLCTLPRVYRHPPHALLEMQVAIRHHCQIGVRLTHQSDNGDWLIAKHPACDVLTTHVLRLHAYHIDILNALMPRPVLGKQFMREEDFRNDAMTPQMPLSELLDCFGDDNKDPSEALMQWDRLCTSAPSTPTVQEPSCDHCPPATVASPIPLQDDWKAAPFTIKGNHTLLKDRFFPECFAPGHV